MISVASGQAVDLSRAIIETIAFFDLFDYPLTTEEIDRMLLPKQSLREELGRLEQAGKLVNAGGYYFLPGRQELVAIRQRRYNYYFRKLKIAKRFGRWFAKLPTILAIYLVNGQGAHNLREASDIDLLIITKPGTIWLSRLYCTGLVALLNKRPRPQDKRDKICLSFYLSADQLNLQELFLKPQDPYFHFWLRNLRLLYDRGEINELFLLANNLPNTKSLISVETMKLTFPATGWWSGLEAGARRLQLAIMNPALKKAAAKQSGGVIINNQILKLYLQDNREKYRELYGQQIQQIFKQNN
ncbi:MAG: hypothetical protein ACOX0C_00225 [Patescibacteria group bacterium]|jgi:hypothetical protein